jgi:hypothetical protein
VAESVLESGLRQKAAVFILGALGRDDHTIAVAFYRALYPGQELLPLKGNFREQDNVRRVSLLGRG